MILSLKSLIQTRLNGLCRNVNQRLRRWTRPYNQSLALNVVLDLTLFWPKNVIRAEISQYLFRVILMVDQMPPVSPR